MKKKTLISFVLLAIIGTSAVFAQQPTLDKLNLVVLGSGATATYRADALNTDISGAVVIPDTYNGRPVTAIGSFGRCTKITSVIIPENVTTIAGNAFLGCTGITSLTIPSSLTRNLGFGLSSLSNSLTSVTFAGSGLPGMNGSFPGDLAIAYQAGGAGTYTRPAGGRNWTKQGGFSLNGTYTRSDGTQITITDSGQTVTITGNYPNNGGRINETLKR